MKRGSTIFLKIAVFLIGVIVLSLCIFFLPWLANDTAEIFPEFAFLQYPVLLGLYLTTIPFFVALYQAIRLLKLIDNEDAFSESSVNSLNLIKYCAITISILYVIGSILLMSQSALHPGIAIIGFIIIFASIVIAVFAGVLQKLLRNALDIKSENDLTV
ncbi:DUF2975 domain-containing protein [Oceanobacillus bengalensis]|uniref:DUF2975 domain-containing protein n=1 Tax=Oceanobacillus bengalensis TaxID=1435466 RepID=A0A494YZL3_9BACI|nr:DUF2975 domain-containing protein [Oceanobacillus bengalensis]RKQ15662.1 DUF2975 domain-containing protein [Oceanobacillus bengalensis]